MNALLRYFLDTNIVSAMVRQPRGPVVERIKAVGSQQIAISIIVASEIRFGLAKAGPGRLRDNVAKTLRQLTVIPFEPPADEHYADIRNTLERVGTPIQPNDMLIAAHTRALGLTLVTANGREFERVPGLAVENWLTAIG